MTKYLLRLRTWSLGPHEKSTVYKNSKWWNTRSFREVSLYFVTLMIWVFLLTGPSGGSSHSRHHHHQGRSHKAGTGYSSSSQQKTSRYYQWKHIHTDCSRIQAVLVLVRIQQIPSSSSSEDSTNPIQVLPKGVQQTPSRKKCWGFHKSRPGVTKENSTRAVQLLPVDIQ